MSPPPSTPVSAPASLDAPLFPDFVSRAPWWGPDLQTLRNLLVGPPAEPPDGKGVAPERIALPLQDGSEDVLFAAIDEPGDRARDDALPTIVLIHGLSGSEESADM